MLKIYGIKACDTMKKAFTKLDELGLAYEFHDYKKSGIDEKTVKAWINELGLDVVLNRKGTTWRKLTPEQQSEAATVDGAIKLLVANTSMIKRPILQSEKTLLAGFSAENYEKLV